MSNADRISPLKAAPIEVGSFAGLGHDFTLSKGGEKMPMTPEEETRFYRLHIELQAREMALEGALKKLLSDEDRNRIKREATELFPYLRTQLLMSFEDVNPTLAGAILRDIENQCHRRG